ncbi:putative glycerophosphoryl diester phosphodiesterase [Pyronema omphalodes]|nr:putative glycerophosphoryl diester phosphodiesterase [Pyronema omphalodes]
MQEKLGTDTPTDSRSPSPSPDHPLLNTASRVLTDGIVARRTQAIAHRGFKVQYPENSLIAFQKAIESGAHAIETDLHLSKDGVVMISHDPSLKRCFGVDKRVIDCDLEELKTYRTVKEPHVEMPTLKEVCEFLVTPEANNAWILLDIKVDNDAETLMRKIGEVVNEVREGSESWKGRIVLGCWLEKYVPLAEKYLPGFPIVHIGFSLPLAKKFLKYPGCGFNLFWPLMQTKSGKAFLEEARNLGREVYVWTVNEEEPMKWAIKNEFIDGVCTDDPVKFLKLCNEFSKTWNEVNLTSFLRLMWFQILASCFAVYFQWKHSK